MSPEQARKAKHAIALSDLQPRQQELALNTLYGWTVENQVEVVRQLARTLAVVNRRSTVFQWVDAKRPDQSHTKAFGLQGAFGVGDEMVGLPITFPFKPMGGQSYISLPDPLSTADSANAIADPGQYVVALSNAANGNTHNSRKQYYAVAPNSVTGIVPPVAQGVVADPTKPTDIDRRLAQGMLASRLSSTMTLRDAVQKTSSSVADDIDEAIAGKPVNVFGYDYAGGARPFLQSIADVYGLQVTGDTARSLSLALPESRLPGDPSHVSAQIRRLIPLPLARSLGSRKSRSAENELYFAAIRRLVALAGPAVPAIDSPPVQVATEGPEAKRLIALALLIGEPLQQLLALRNYAPSYALLHPDTLLMSMRRDMSGQTPRLSLSYGHISKDGISYITDGMCISTTVAQGKSSSDRVH